MISQVFGGELTTVFCG